jgi:hypothetical protein
MRNIFLILAVATLCVSASFVSSAQSIDEVIMNHVNATGGADNWKKINSMKITGHIEVQGIEIPFTQVALHSKGYRVDAEFQGMQIIQITNSSKSWEQMPFAGKTNLEPSSDDEHKQRVDQLDIQNEFVNWKEKGSKVELLGKDEEDGNEYYKVRLTTKTGNSSVHFIDTKSYLIYKTKRTAKMQGQEIEMETKFMDYKLISVGVKVPHKTDQSGQVLVFDKIEVNVSIPETTFEVK